MLNPIVLALALFTSKATGQTASQVPPKPQIPEASAEFLTWHGWGYLQGATAKWPAIYDTSGDWSMFAAAATAAASSAKPPVWRLRVVIFTRTEADARDASGVLREHRGTIEAAQLERVRASIMRLGLYASAKFGGAVTIEPEITLETEWMRDGGPSPFGPAFIEKYLGPRINGGTYEAEDKVFRGPYNSAMYVLPGSVSTPLPDDVINDTPVAALPTVPLGADGLSQDFDAALRAAWYRQLEYRAKEQGYRGVLVAPGQTTPPDAWTNLTSLEEAPAAAYLARLSTTLTLNAAVPDPPAVKVPILPTTDQKIVPDTDKGQVLQITEMSGIRDGGMALPIRSDGAVLNKLDTAPTLSFSVKSASKDPLAIRVESSNGKVGWICLGRDDPLVWPMPGAAVLGVRFVPDGTWQKVAVDLHALAKQAGLVDVSLLAIEPTPNCKLAGKIRPDPIQYEFTDFQFSSDAATPLAEPVSPSATSDDPEARALFAAQAKQPSPDLATLLKDKSDLVRLNATAAYVGFKDHSVEDALVSNSLDLDPAVAEAALEALMAEGSDTAIAVVRRSVTVSLSDYAKTVAARLVVEHKDPNAADEISPLLANRSWQAHVAAVEDLAKIPGPDSQIWRLAFIGMSDPEVKLAVTANADPSVDKVVPPLLWSSVNEPSDMVRFESYIKLIQAPTAATRAEGYKGVRDDSRWVRKAVLRYLATYPNEENRNALRIAIADRSAQVRALAIRGFAALEKGASADELASVMDDPSPEVQLALVDLSKKKGLKLPDKTVAAMLASPDSRVVDAAKSLKG